MAKRKASPRDADGTMFPEKPVAKFGTVTVKRMRSVGGKLLPEFADGTPQDTAELASEAIRRLNERNDIASRIAQYRQQCLELVLPFAGAAPAGLADDRWAIVVDLPEAAPGEARDAQRCLRLLNIFTDQTLSQRERNLIVCALDAGRILQRIADRKFEPEVAAARNSRAGRLNRVRTQQTAAEAKRLEVVAEFTKRSKSSSLSNEQIYKDMAAVPGPDGNPRWGSASTIKKHILASR